MWTLLACSAIDKAIVDSSLSIRPARVSHWPDGQPAKRAWTRPLGLKQWGWHDNHVGVYFVLRGDTVSDEDIRGRGLNEEVGGGDSWTRLEYGL